jgi:chemotaxis protein CheZ
MLALSDERDIGKRVEAIAGGGDGIDPEQILEVVESVMTSIDGDLSTVNLKFYAEIESLSRFIENLKQELATVRPDEINDEHLPTATDELEAIVGSTEQATNSIFEAVEAIEDLAGKMDADMAEQVTDAVTKVYEACGFQLAAFGEEVGRQPGQERPKQKPLPDQPKRPDEHLMHGPQLESEANNQDDIDAILAGFD